MAVAGSSVPACGLRSGGRLGRSSWWRCSRRRRSAAATPARAAAARLRRRCGAGTGWGDGLGGHGVPPGWGLVGLLADNRPPVGLHGACRICDARLHARQACESRTENDGVPDPRTAGGARRARRGGVGRGQAARGAGGAAAARQRAGERRAAGAGAVGRGRAGGRGEDGAGATSRGCARRSATPERDRHDAGAAIGCGAARTSSTPSASSARGRRGGGRWPRATPSAAAQLLREALALWRGAAAGGPGVRAVRAGARSRGWRSSGWPRWRRASRPTSPPGAHADAGRRAAAAAGRAPDARAAARRS